MEENKIFIVVDNLELRDGDKVKGFCGLFFQAEKALDYVIENQKKSHDLEVITYPIPLSYEEIVKKTPTTEPDTTPYPWPNVNPQPYLGDWPLPQVWYGTGNPTITTNGTGNYLKGYPSGETSCTLQFSKK